MTTHPARIHRAEACQASMKRVFTLAVLALLSSPVGVAPQARLQVTLSTPSVEVGSMPLQMRGVPIHPDDDFVSPGNAGPILQEEFSTGPIMLAVGAAASVPLSGPWRLLLAVNTIVHPRLRAGPASDRLALRNYTDRVGTQLRGDGAALTFVGIEPSGLVNLWILALSPRVGLEWSLPGGSASLGVAGQYYRIDAVSGWDRFNKLETWDRRSLAHVYPLELYVSLRMGDVGRVSVGVQRLAKQVTDLGREAATEVSDFALAISLGLSGV